MMSSARQSSTRRGRTAAHHRHSDGTQIGLKLIYLEHLPETRCTVFELFDNGGKAGTRATHYRTPPARPATPEPFPHHATPSTQPSPPLHESAPSALTYSRSANPPTDRPGSGTDEPRMGSYGRADRESPPPPNSHTPTLSSPPHSDRRPGQGTSASSGLVTAAQQMERRKSEDGRRGNTVEQQLSSTVLGSSFR